MAVIHMKKYKDLRVFLMNEYLDELTEVSKRFYFKNKKYLDIKAKNIEHITSSFVDSIDISSFYISDIEKNNIIIHLNVMLSIVVKGKRGIGKFIDFDEEIIYRYIVITINVNPFKFKETFKIINVTRIDEKKDFKIIGSASKRIVPYMKSEDLDYYAEKFLKEMYSEALIKPMQIPVLEIARKLGLTIENKKLMDESFGKIYFIDDLEDGISAKTILIDEEKVLDDLCGNKRNTIVHECVHWYFHRNYFAIQQLLNPMLTFIKCNGIDKMIQDDILLNDDYHFMEWQANNLAPRILMPSKMLKVKYDEIYLINIQKYKGKLHDIYYETLKEIALFFGVSTTLAKIRLIEIGITEYIGINENENDSYIVKNQKMDINETYRVSFLDVVLAKIKNRLLNDALNNERMVYIDGFLVINSKEYIEIINGKRTLKKEALENIENCCLRFKRISGKKDSSRELYALYWLSRKKKRTAIESNNEFEESEENKAILKRSKNYCDFYKDLEDDELLIKKMGNKSFYSAFRVLFDELEIVKFRKCARLCGTTANTIIKYYDGNGEPPNYKMVLAICAGLCLRPNVAFHLLSTIGINLQTSSRMEDKLYCDLVLFCYEEGLENWNKHIKEAKLGDEFLLP